MSGLQTARVEVCYKLLVKTSSETATGAPAPVSPLAQTTVPAAVTIGGMTGQGAFDGRGAASTSFERFPDRPMPRAKPAASGAATTGAESAQRTSGAPKALRGSAAHEADGSAVTALGQASGQSSTAGSASTPATTAPATTARTPAPRTPSPIAASPSVPPAAVTSATGAGSVDAQHSRGDNSVAVSGEASGSASRTQ